MEPLPVPEEVRQWLKDQIAIVVRRDRQRKQKARKRAAEKAVKAEKAAKRAKCEAKCEASPTESSPHADTKLSKDETIAHLQAMAWKYFAAYDVACKELAEQRKSAAALQDSAKWSNDSAKWWMKTQADKDETIAHLERCVFNARYGSELNEHGDTGNRRGGGRKRNWRKWFNQQPDDKLEEFGRHIKHAWCISNEYM